MELTEAQQATRKSLGLTQTEYRILEHLARGTRPVTIAVMLGIGRGTAKTHLRHIFCKLNLKSWQDTFAYAEQLGVDPGTVKLTRKELIRELDGLFDSYIKGSTREQAEAVIVRGRTIWKKLEEFAHGA